MSGKKAVLTAILPKTRAKERRRSHLPTARCSSAKVCRQNNNLQKKKSSVALAFLRMHLPLRCFAKFPTELRNRTLPWIARRRPSHSAKREPSSTQWKTPGALSPFPVSVRKLENQKREWNETNAKLCSGAPLKCILLQQCFPDSPSKTQLGKIEKTGSQAPTWRFWTAGEWGPEIFIF